MAERSLYPILEARLLVGYLGERAQFAWWPTAFYEASSRLFLEPVLAKTSDLAQYHGVLEAARRLHDEHLSVGSYHLFRLPEEMEQDLHILAQASSAAEYLLQSVSSRDAALNALGELAGGVLLNGVGPIGVGALASINAPKTVQSIAAAYNWAFKHDVKTYPYLVA